MLSSFIHAVAKGISSFFLSAIPKFLIHDVINSWSADVEGLLYVLFYATLHKGFEEPLVLISVGFLEPITHGYWGKSIVQFWGEGRSQM